MVEESANQGMSPDRVRQLINSALREAAELGEGPPVPPLPPSDAVPGFEIVEEIGRGGMGVVYRALQLSTKRVVALKIMLAGWYASPPAQKRFQREVELTARSQHAGIVRVLESGSTSTGQPYYAMDYVDGDPLDQWASTAQPDVRTTVALFGEICAAVSHAHEHGVVHRDLKPGNVLVDEDGKPHILDFGLSKALDQDATEDQLTAVASMPGQVVGTLRYLSPEQAAGTPGEIDVRTDVYALGVMLYESLTGVPPFGSTESPSETIQHILESPPPSPSSLSNRVDHELETIILKALEKEKSRRYQTVREFGEDIGRYLRNEPILARPPSSLYMLRKKLLKRRMEIAVAGAALALAVVGIWSGTWWRERSFEQQRERGRANARHQLLAVQCRLEEGAPGKEEVRAGAQRFMSGYPDLPEAVLVCAQASFRLAQERGDESVAGHAIAILEAAFEQRRFRWAYGTLLAEIFDSMGNPRAERFRPDVERVVPDTAEAWYVWSFATLDVQKALVCAEHAVNRDRQHRLAWERLACLRVLAGDTEGALRATETLIASGADPLQCLLFQGRTLIRRKEYVDALARYTRAIRLEPVWVAYRCRALAHLCLRQYDQAILDYTSASKADSASDMWEQYHRATPLWITGRIEEAEKDYRTFCDRRGVATFADARLFLVLRGQAKYDEASQVLAAARSVVQNKWLGSVLACLGGDMAPDALVGSAESEHPPGRERLCEAYYYAGEACLLAGRTDHARGWFQKCVDVDLAFDPDSEHLDPMHEYHLARWRLGQLSGNIHAKPDTAGG